MPIHRSLSAFVSAVRVILALWFVESPARYISTKVHQIEGVIHPQTQQEISVSEAVSKGIINEETGR